jgi:hypothetical protein
MIIIGILHGGERRGPVSAAADISSAGAGDQTDRC